MSSRLNFVGQLVDWEETERRCRGLERRLRNAHLGRFKPLSDFDWQWPKRCDQAAVASMMSLDLMKDASNLLLVDNNGVGKSMIA